MRIEPGMPHPRGGGPSTSYAPPSRAALPPSAPARDDDIDTISDFPAPPAGQDAQQASGWAGDAEDDNSEDEHEHTAADIAALAELESSFDARLEKNGLHIRRMAQDGNCLFRCISDRVYGDAEMHDVSRQLIMDHIERERDHFSQYITQDFGAYVARKRRDRVHGNHVELQAASEIYNRPVHVYDVAAAAHAGSVDEPLKPMNAFSSPSPPEGRLGRPLRLSYHGRNHYNALHSPDEPEVGEGLGLPGLQLGLADRTQMQQALSESEAAALDDQIMAEALEATRARRTELEAAHAKDAWGADDAANDEALRRALQQSMLEAYGGAGASGSTSADAQAASSCRRDAGCSRSWRELVRGEDGPSSLQPPAQKQPRLCTSTAQPAPSAGAGAPSLPAAAAGEPLPEGVALLVQMGFALPRAVAAYDQFGDDLDSSLEFLTS